MRKTTSQYILIIISIGWFFTACNDKSQNGKYITKAHVIHNYLSNDGSYHFELQEDTINNLCLLKDARHNKVYRLKRVRSSSRVEYANADSSISFWREAKQFAFLKSGSIIAEGYLIGYSPKKVGVYVSSGYKQRKTNDWISVSITDASAIRINVSIRSRADKKKPTCTLDAIALKQSDNVYIAYIDDANVVLKFKHDTLSITPQNPKKYDNLKRYCSGGGSIQGNYYLLKECLDQSQVDQTLYSKTIAFYDLYINAIKNAKGDNELTIKSLADNQWTISTTYAKDTKIINVEAEDINGDGFPEVLAYFQSQDQHKYGSVIGYSSGPKASISKIYLPPIRENAKLGKGYYGHDYFAIVETTFIQRFPLYELRENNYIPTGERRQIQYKLKKDGETPIFVIDRITQH